LSGTGEVQAREHVVSAAMESVVEAFDAISVADPRIDAWEFLDKDRALKEAEAADRLHRGKSLYGLVVAVKDIFDTADMVTSYGSPIFSCHLPAKDAAIVAFLRENGAVILGKTRTTELATSRPTTSLNPRNLDYSPGGSSSGSAAAVAAGMVPLALGTQTLGSVIRPASFCGVFGFKPSYGRLSRTGVLLLSETLDTVGVLSNSLADIERFYRCAVEPASSRLDTFTPRLGFCHGPGWDNVNGNLKRVFSSYVDGLTAQGVSISEMCLPSEFEALLSTAQTIHDYEVRRNFTWELAQRYPSLSPNFQAILERGRRIGTADYERALAVGEQCRSLFAQAMRGFDALVTLSATDEAPLAAAGHTGSPAANTAWTFLRGPSVSLPVLMGPQGMPVGLQVVGEQFSDERVLASAHYLDRLHATAEASNAKYQEADSAS